MKILYGVQGTGNGHLTRARCLSKHFSAHNAQVDYVFSGRARDKYFDMEAFGDWKDYHGLTFAIKDGKIRTLKTVVDSKPIQLIRDIRSLPVNDYDVIITDFEPITAWAAKMAKRDCLGIGHQYAFNFQIPIAGDNIATRSIMRYFAPTTHSLGVHWHHFGHPILPPIVEDNHTPSEVSSGAIIVYLPFENPDNVISMLSKIGHTQFLFYGAFDGTKTVGNVTLNPISRDKFQQDLAACNGVICNAGFELSSESLNLGKKLLVKPLHGQMEQLSNGLALSQLKLGMSAHVLSVDIIEKWLAEFQPTQVRYPDVGKAIVEWILSGNYLKPSEGPETLAKTLWSQTDFGNLALS